MHELSVAEMDLLRRIEQKPDLVPIFFRKVKGIRWFNELAARGFLDADKNPFPIPAEENGYVKIPTWHAVQYLVRTAPELKNQDNTEYAKKFLNVLFSTTEYAKVHGFHNYRTWWDFVEIFQHIPSRIIAVDHLAMVGYWLLDPFDRGPIAQRIAERLIPTFLDGDNSHDRELAAFLFESLFTVTFVDHEIGERQRHVAQLRIPYSYAERVRDHGARRVGEILGIQAAEFIERQLVTALEELNIDSWTSLWQPAIEPHEQNKHHDDAQNLLVEVHREVLAGFVAATPTQARDYVNRLLDSGYKTIRRLAVHTITQNYQLFDATIHRLIANEYFTDSFRHEMWRLLNGHYIDFSAILKEHVANVISNICITDDDGILHTAASAHRRAAWYSAIKHYGPEENRMYFEETTRAGADPENPSFSNYMAMRPVIHESPIAVDVLQGMEVDQLVHALEPYRENSWQFMEPGIEGLSKAFRQAIETSPLKYFLNLKAFAGLDPTYLYEVLEAYRELWTQKKPLPWDDIWPPLLDFCMLVLQRSDLWAGDLSASRSAFIPNRHGVVLSIGRLIQSGVKSDDHAFDPVHIQKAEEIVAILLKHQEGEHIEEVNDAVTAAINSPRGQALDALINIALRRCRLSDQENKKNHAQVWAHFQPYFDSELDRTAIPEYEFVTLAACCLPNFLYMSSDWTLQNMHKIFSRGNLNLWRCAIEGYGYVGKLYPEFYTFFKNEQHFVQVLDDVQFQERTRERILQHLIVGYVSGFETLQDDNSLVGLLLDRSKYEELSQLIWFFWTMRQNDSTLREKVYELWPRLLKLADTSTREGQQLASQLCLWTMYVEEIDEKSRPLLAAVAPFADVQHNGSLMMEALASLSASQPFEVHSIWMKILERSAPSFPKESILQILSNLLGKGANGRRKARDAVSRYISYGVEEPAEWLAELCA